MRILVTGRHGQLALALEEQAQGRPGFMLTTLGRPVLDVTDAASIDAALAAARPDVVVNAAAYTAVDKAESEPARAFAVNRDGAAAVAAAAARRGIHLIHISTDYVYGGDKPSPYVESDPTGPVNIYGLSKLSGEAAVRQAHPAAVILRTAWIYSPWGSNFVKTMLRLAQSRPVLRVVDDQFGNPTSALALADAILTLAQRLDQAGGVGGVYHIAGRGSVTWCGLAREVLAIGARHGLAAAAVEAITTADYPTPARRPRNSRLDTTLLAGHYGAGLPDWRLSLEETVRRLAQGEAAP